MSNSELIERLHGYARTSKDSVSACDDYEQAAHALQACEWSHDMEAMPKKVNTLQMLPDTGEIYLIHGDKWLGVTLPEETQ